MKQILLLRHAKSSHGESGLKDFDRPLAPRGTTDARRMGVFLKEVESLPELIISSTAKRAEQTTRLFLEGAGLGEDIIQWNEDLYYGSSGDYLTSIQTCHPELVSGSLEINTIMLVGHNPKIENIAGRLCGNGSVRMPTAALVCLEQPASQWSQVREGMASLKWMMIPKILKKFGGG